jgi:hypothetical protein
MKPRCARLKGFCPPPFARRLLALGALGLAGACAESPAPPADDNHAPAVISIAVVGGRPNIAAGTLNVQLEAVTQDIDGDALTLTWSGPGSFHSQNDAPGGGTVRWNVPAGQFGALTVSCKASDGAASDSLAQAFPVGQALTTADYGTLVGNTITWSDADAPFYVLQQDVEIPAAVTLEVAAGTRVWCEGDTRLTIGGSLVVAGLAGEQVVFQPNAAATSEAGLWNGIYFASSGGTLAMDFCNVLNAEVGVNLELGTGLGAQLESCSFVHCSDAVKVAFGEISLLGCRAEDFGQGIVADATALSIENCTFVDGSEESISLRSGSSGSCAGCFFTDVAAPYISISGGSHVDFHDNRFFGTGVAFLIGAGYGAAPEPLDGRCNWWGDGAGEAAIIARIDDAGGDTAPLIYTPWRAVQSGACGEDPPVVLAPVAVVDDERHPLHGDPPPGVDLSAMAVDGYPRLLVVGVQPQHDGFVHDYAWSTTAGGTLFAAGGLWPLGDPYVQNYAGQTDDAAGSAIFFLPAGVEGETVTVTITDNWGQSVASGILFEY